MKKLFTKTTNNRTVGLKIISTAIISLFINQNILSQPANDCPSGAIHINQCGVNFSTTIADMQNATKDDNTNCPGDVCEAFAAYGTNSSWEDYDCDPNTGRVSTSGYSYTGDDFHYINPTGGFTNTTVENTLFWYFIAYEDCQVRVNIDVANCQGRTNVGTSAAQYMIWEVSDELPIGSILNQMAGSGNAPNGSYSELLDITSGTYVYLILDGVNSSDCDIDVSVTNVDCAGCAVLSSSGNIKLKAWSEKENNKITWASNQDQNNLLYSIEKSENGINFHQIGEKQNNQGLVNYKFIDRFVNSYQNYYRVKQTNTNGEEVYSKIVKVINSQIDKKIIKRVNIFGQEVGPDTPGIIIEIYNDHSIRKVFN